MTDANEILKRASNELDAARLLANNGYPLQAVEMMSLSVRSAIRAAAITSGYNFGRDTDPECVMLVVPEEVFASSSPDKVCTLLSAAMAVVSQGDQEGDFLDALPRDLDTAAEIIYDIAGYTAGLDRASAPGMA